MAEIDRRYQLFMESFDIQYSHQGGILDRRMDQDRLLGKRKFRNQVKIVNRVDLCPWFRSLHSDNDVNIRINNDIPRTGVQNNNNNSGVFPGEEN